MAPIPPIMAILFAVAIPCFAGCFTCCFVRCAPCRKPKATGTAENAATKEEKGDDSAEDPGCTQTTRWEVCAPITLVLSVLASFFTIAIVGAIFAAAGGLEWLLYYPITDSACSTSCAYEVRNGLNWAVDENCCSYTDSGPLTIARQDVWLQYPSTATGAATNVIHGFLMVNATRGAPRGRLSVLYCHGSGNNVAAGYRSERYAHYLSLGNVAMFVFDYPGYGKSPGQPSTYSVQGTVEASEAAAQWFASWDAAYNPVTGYAPLPASTLSAPIVLPTRDLSAVDLSNVTVLGRSLGWSMATWVSSNARVTPNGLILQSAFSSVTDLAKYYMPMYWWTVAGTAKSSFAEYDTRANVARYAAATAAARRCVFHSHSKSDEWVPFWHAERLRTALTDAGMTVSSSDGTGCFVALTLANAIHTQPLVIPEEERATLLWLSGRRI